jgi:beta-mannosidase
MSALPLQTIELQWQVGPHTRREDEPKRWIPATVPGAVQLDWARAESWPPYWQSDNFKNYRWMEDSFWTYKTTLDIPELERGQRLIFVCNVDYQCEVWLDNELEQEFRGENEGMFAPVEVELTGRTEPGSELRVIVYPVPKSRPSPEDRSQANHSCKPAVSYGWDFHPRLVPLGIWDNCRLEVRSSGFILQTHLTQELSDDFSSARIRFGVWLNRPFKRRTRWTLISPCGETWIQERAPRDLDASLDFDRSESFEAEISNPELWWPHDHGNPSLYTSRVELLNEAGEVVEVREQRIGFRRVKLVMAPGQWDWPDAFPKPRSHPPMTLEINGRPIFAKGANWVSPEIFPGLLNRETYETQLRLACDANMNLLRMWGGAPIQKEAFYELCDELGIMVWQEFPLACNNYPDDDEYLRILDVESRAIIERLKPHPSVVMWCGGNELFNSWSGMTDQSLALRLLNSNCYRLDPHTPFLPTSPVDGVGHGHYVFRDMTNGEEAWQVFQRARNTAYCEFGCPGVAPIETLREIIPENELFPPRPGTNWETHHAFGVWQENSWLGLDVIEHYFGRCESLEEIVARGQLLQAEGYKGLFEEARRQKPTASMALCWCFNEPWPTAANNSLLSWPSRPKPALGAVGEACRPVLASARIRKFEWQEGEVFDPELWWLSDAPTAQDVGPIEARIEAEGRVWPLLTWDGGTLEPNTNLPGPQLRWTLPDLGAHRFELVLHTPQRPEAASRYTLLFRPRPRQDAPATATMNL